MLDLPPRAPLEPSPRPYYSAYGGRSEEDGTRHVINDFIWEKSIRTISTKVEDVSHKNL